jgi:hypothetical protein
VRARDEGAEVWGRQRPGVSGVLQGVGEGVLLRHVGVGLREGYCEAGVSAYRPELTCQLVGKCRVPSIIAERRRHPIL